MVTPLLLLALIISSALALPKIHPGRNGVNVGVNVVLGSAEDIKSAAANTSRALKVGNNGGSWNAELKKAIKSGDVVKAKHTINSEVDVNAYSSDGCPFEPGRGSKFPYDNPALVQTLIEQGADVNCLGKDSWAPLVSAVRQHFWANIYSNCNGSTHKPMDPNRVKVMELLVEAGADIDHLTTDHPGPTGYYGDYTTSALLGATWRPCWSVEAIKLFISSGANVNIKSQLKKTPLHQASWGTRLSPTNLEVVELLISKGADVNARSYCWDCETPLHRAIKYKQYKVAEYLRTHGGLDITGCPVNTPPCPYRYPYGFT